MSNYVYTTRRAVLPVMLQTLDHWSQELVDRQMDDDDYDTVRKLWDLFRDLNQKIGSRYPVLESTSEIQVVARIKRRMDLVGLSYGPQEGS